MKVQNIEIVVKSGNILVIFIKHFKILQYLDSNNVLPYQKSCHSVKI